MSGRRWTNNNAQNFALATVALHAIQENSNSPTTPTTGSPANRTPSTLRHQQNRRDVHDIDPREERVRAASDASDNTCASEARVAPARAACGSTTNAIKAVQQVQELLDKKRKKEEQTRPLILHPFVLFFLILGAAAAITGLVMHLRFPVYTILTAKAYLWLYLLAIFILSCIVTWPVVKFLIKVWRFSDTYENHVYYYTVGTRMGFYLIFAATFPWLYWQFFVNNIESLSGQISIASIWVTRVLKGIVVLGAVWVVKELASRLISGRIQATTYRDSVRAVLFIEKIIAQLTGKESKRQQQILEKRRLQQQKPTILKNLRMASSRFAAGIGGGSPSLSRRKTPSPKPDTGSGSSSVAPSRANSSDTLTGNRGDVGTQHGDSKKSVDNRLCGDDDGAEGLQKMPSDTPFVIPVKEKSPTVPKRRKPSIFHQVNVLDLAKTSKIQVSKLMQYVGTPSKKISSRTALDEMERLAKENARKIFNRLDFNSTGFITPDDFKRAIKLQGEDQSVAYECFDIFDQNGDGTISEPELVNILVEVYMHRRSIQLSLRDTRSIEQSLEEVVSFVFIVIAFICELAVFGVDVVSTVIAMSSVFLAASFALGPLLQQLLFSFVLVFFLKPYNVGDRVSIANDQEQYTVQSISLWSTDMLDGGGRRHYWHNGNLAKEHIVNHTRTTDMDISVELGLSINTPQAVLELIKERVTDLCRDDPNFYSQTPSVNISGLAVERSIICRFR